MRFSHTRILIWVILFITRTSYGQPVTQSLKQGKNNILFIENKGQLLNSSGKTDDDVLYTVKCPSFTVYIYHNGLSYQFTSTADKEKNHKPLLADQEETLLKSAVKTHRVDLRFKNSNSNTVAIAEDEVSYFENYYSSAYPNGITNVRACKKVTVKNIYPGIDWVLYSINGNLKYDFIVQPYVDVALIQMQVIRADAVERISDTELNIITRLGEISDRHLVAFENETGTQIPVSFQLNDHTISFETANYNRHNTLTIDPEIIWSTYYGGEFEDAINSMSITEDGFIYITGYTRSETAMAGLGYDNVYNGGSYDMYCAKLDTLGNKIWGTYHGGTNSDFGTAVCVDDAGNVYVSGFTLSINFPTTPGVFQETNSGAYDAFIVKMSGSGTLGWATCFGGNSSDYARSITVDHAGYVYLAGSAYSGTLGFNGFQNMKGGDNDQILAKFSPTGNRIWSTYLGGERDDYCRGVTVDADNNIFLAGYSESLNGVAYHGFDTIWANKNDATLAKFDSSGDLLWSTYFGGNAEDNGNGVAVDENGNAYLAVQSGTTTGLGFNGYKNSGGGSMDAMLIKFDPEGNRKWSTYYGGTGEDMGKAVCVVDEFVYLSGHTYSFNHINYYGFQTTLTGWSDALLAKFDTTGNFYWASYAGGFDIEYGRCVVAKNPYSIYHGGKTFSFTFPTTPDAHQEIFGGDPSDGFIQKISDCPIANVFYTDADNDGYGADPSILSCNVSVAGYVLNNFDCNDGDIMINPIASEICNSIDDNCNGSTDDADILLTDAPVWYHDNDGDLFGNGSDTLNACLQPAEYIALSGDCNDTNVLINPGAIEICNALDDDCDVLIDNDVVFTTYYADTDGDGYGNSFSTISVCTEIPEGYAAIDGDCHDGNFSIHPAATELCNTLDDDCDALTDENLIISTITPSGPTSYCKGGSLTLSANTGAGYIYQWKRNGSNIAGATTSTYAVSKSGNYTVNITIPGGCSDISNMTPVTIYNKPDPAITALGSLDICAAGSVKLKTGFKTGDTYQWYKNDVLIPGATNNTYIAVSTGTYKVKETTVFGCTKTSAPVVVTSSCKLNGETSANVLQIFPNPIQNNLFVNLHTQEKESGDVEMILYNDIGAVIYRETGKIISGNLYEEIILPASVANGIYLFQLITSREIYTQQIVVAR